MIQKLKPLMIAAFLFFNFAIPSKPALALDPIIVPLPVLNLYSDGSYFQLTVASEDRDKIAATLAIGDQSLEATLNEDSVIRIENIVDGVSKPPSLNAYLEDGGFVIRLSNAAEGQVKFSIEGGEELAVDVNKDILSQITLTTSQSSKLQLINSDSSVVAVNSFAYFLSFGENFALPIRFAADATPLDTTGGEGGSGGEPDKGTGDDTSGGEPFPLNSAAGGCSLNHLSDVSLHGSFVGLMALSVFLSGLILRRKARQIKTKL